MEPYWKEAFGNPHSTDHVMGWKADDAVSKARALVAELIGADASEIVFTSGATEANNLALTGLTRSAPSRRNRILVSAIEHKSVMETAAALRMSGGSSVGEIPVDRDGFIALSALDAMLSGDVLLVSVMVINNEIGTIQDIPAIARLLRPHGVLLHCDAAQAPCGVDISGLAEHADLVSLSGHKFYGPKGIGALWIRRGLEEHMTPLLYGGGQQRGIRSGTVPVPLCVGMGVAAELSTGAIAADERRRIARLRDEFVQEVENGLPCVGLNGPLGPRRHPGNANLRFPGVNGQDLIAAMQPEVAAATGSACTTGLPEPSHVLRAVGLSPVDAGSSVRFSFGRFSTHEEVTTVGRLAVETARSLNALAP